MAHMFHYCLYILVRLIVMIDYALSYLMERVTLLAKSSVKKEATCMPAAS